jgi:hypothetical protein
MEVIPKGNLKEETVEKIGILENGKTNIYYHSQ